MCGFLCFVDTFYTRSCVCFDQSGKTPLHRVSLMGRLELVRCLVEAGADLEVHI